MSQIAKPCGVIYRQSLTKKKITCNNEGKDQYNGRCGHHRGNYVPETTNKLDVCADQIKILNDKVDELSKNVSLGAHVINKMSKDLSSGVVVLNKINQMVSTMTTEYKIDRKALMRKSIKSTDFSYSKDHQIDAYVQHGSEQRSRLFELRRKVLLAVTYNPITQVNTIIH